LGRELSGKGGLALKLLDRIWNLLGLVESDELEETEKGGSEKANARTERKNERPAAKVLEDSRNRRAAPPDPSSVGNPTSLPVKTNPQSSSARDPEIGKGIVVITQPMGFDDARQIAENVKNGKTVLVNFERTDSETIKRTVDFMSGITYAVSGTVQRVSNTIFLFAPARVEIYATERFATDGPEELPWRRS
jgi:cell division inhibitor SepF